MNFVVWYGISCFVAGGLLIIASDTLRDLRRGLLNRSVHKHEQRMACIQAQHLKDRATAITRSEELQVEAARIQLRTDELNAIGK